MKKENLILYIFIPLFLFVNTYTFAYWPDLAKEQIDEAIKYGQEFSKKLGLDSEWCARSPRAAGWVELITPFSAAAKLARDYSLKSKPIREKDIKRAVAPYKRKLIFDYHFYDIEKRFTFTATSEYFAMIRTQDNRIIYPLRYEKGTESVSKTYLEFSFLSGKIDPNSVIYLLIREPSGFEHEFKFDLSKIH